VASFYNLTVVFKDGSKAPARGVGNNAAWACKCGEILLGPTIYPIDPCPGCERKYVVVASGGKPAISQVEEV